jgi:hypothetical protein
MRVLNFDGDKPIESHITGDQVDAYVKEALRLFAIRQSDYEEWTLVYNRRNEKHRFMPVAYRQLAEDEPEAIEIDKARLAKGLPLTLRIVSADALDKLSTSHRSRKRDRDAKIREERAAGASLKELATKFKLKSTVRISQTCSRN